MRQHLITLALIATLTACGGGGGNQAASDNRTTPAAVLQVQAVPSAIESSTTTSAVAAKAVDLTDAIAILKMIVGLDVNAGGAALTAYQAYAADVDGNGKVELSDAISVLKRIVGLETATANWMFFNGTPTVSDKLNPGLPASVSAAVSSDTNVSMTAVLRGDVVSSSAYTYSWALTSKPTGSSASLASTTAANPSFKADVAGAYVATMTITDGSSNVASSSVTVTACSASSNSSSPFTGCASSGATASISGIAATGSAMMGATITLQDATGKTTNTTAGDDGSYTFDNLTGYTAPYQLSATVLMGEKNVTHYSVIPSLAASTGANTVNINQLTSAVVALVAPTGTVADLTSTQLAAITATQVNAAVSKIQTVLAPVAANITGASNFNPITTSFTANGSGPDALLDHINVNISSTGVDLSNKMAVPNSTDKDTSSATSTLAKGSSATPSGMTATDAVDFSAIDALMAKFKKCFAVSYTARLSDKTRTSATLHADCQGIAGSNYLHNGNTFISRWANMLNSQYAGATSKIFRPEMRLRLSSNPPTIAVNFNMTDTAGNGFTMPEVIQKQNGAWVLYGNQRTINAFVEAEQTHYIDLTPNTTYTNVNNSRIDAGFRIYVDPRTTFDLDGNPTNQGIDLTKNNGTSTDSWSTIRSQAIQTGNAMVKCVVVTGPGNMIGSTTKWMGFHPNGVLLKRPSGSTVQDYMAIDSILSSAKNTALLAAKLGDRVTASNQDLCPDASSAQADLDSGGVTTNSASSYVMDLLPLTNQKNPITGQVDTSIDGRDKRWNTGPNFARTAPDAALQQTLNNNPKVTFYVIDTDNKLRMKFDVRYLGDLPTVADAQALMDNKKLSELSKTSIATYLDYSGTQNAATSVSLDWTNPQNGFNADMIGFYSNVYQSTPGTGLRGPLSVVTANKTTVGTDGLWNQDGTLAAEVDALTGTNFYWRFSSITKAKDSAGACTGNYLVSSLNVGVPKVSTSIVNKSIGGTWYGKDTQATACGKVVSASSTVNGVTTTTYPQASNTYLHREIWLRTYTSSNVRVYRYWAKKNIS